MSGKSFFARCKRFCGTLADSVRSLRTSRHLIDVKLLKHLPRSPWPRWSQLKYLRHFLSPAEKRVLVGSVVVGIGALLLAGGFFLRGHLTNVPAVGGEYTEALVGQPTYVNPLFASNNEVDSDLSALVYSGLFTLGEQYELIPELAATYTVKNEGKVYDITLAENQTWSDGEPVTASDVVYTWQMIQNPEVGSPLFSVFQGVEVEKIDSLTIRFTLPQPFSLFLHSLTVGIIPEHMWGAVAPANLKLSKYNLQPVGTGKWQFSKLLKDDLGSIQSYTLTPNDRFRGSRPYLNEVTFKFYPTLDQAIEVVRTRQVAAVSFLPTNLTSQFSGQHVATYTVRLPQYTALFFNQEAAPTLKNTPLREALARGLDKPKLIAEALGGAGAVVDAPIAPGQVGYHPEVKRYEFDPVAAATLLDAISKRLPPEDYFKLQYRERTAAGSTTTTSTPTNETPAPDDESISQQIRAEMPPDQPFYRTTEDGKVLALTITTRDLSDYVAAAESIARLWRAVGVKTSVEQLPSRIFTRDVLRNHRYQVLLSGELLSANPDLFPFWHSSQIEYPGLNLARFADRDGDQLLEEARKLLAAEARTERYQKFQNILAAKLPAIFLYSPYAQIAIAKKVRARLPSIISTPAERFRYLSEWYTKTKWRWR